MLKAICYMILPIFVPQRLLTLIKRLIFILFASYGGALAFSQPGPAEKYLSYEIEALAPGSSPHRLTVFVIPSRSDYDWGSPNTLRSSLISNYIKNILSKECYLLGHAFIGLETPLTEERILSGMRAASREQQQEMLLKEHYGLSILGADLEGELEDPVRLGEKVEQYARKGALAFITLLISEEAAERMVEFFRAFSSGEDSLASPRFHYGGAFWPRYYGEGAGCSAFAMAFLDLGGLLREEYEKWRVEVDIPRDLMGGPYNDWLEVKLGDVRKARQWAESAEAGEPFMIYEPTFIYQWIQDHWLAAEISGMPSKPVKIHDARGILLDARQVPAPTEEPIFMEREVPSIFVE